MSSLVTSPERSVAGKITRSGLETRNSRPPASTVVASDLAMSTGAWRTASTDLTHRAEEIGAGLLAPAAGLGAQPAVLVMLGMPFALLGAYSAGLHAGLDEGPLHGYLDVRLARQHCPGGYADVGAVQVQPDAAHEVLQIVFGQVRVCAGGARLGAREALHDASHESLAGRRLGVRLEHLSDALHDYSLGRPLDSGRHPSGRQLGVSAADQRVEIRHRPEVPELVRVDHGADAPDPALVDLQRHHVDYPVVGGEHDRARLAVDRDPSHRDAADPLRCLRPCREGPSDARAAA